MLMLPHDEDKGLIGILLIIFSSVIKIALFIFSRVRGTKTVSEHKGFNNQLGFLKAFVVCGYEVTIHCHRKKYCIKYDRWFIPNRTVMTYNVFSMVSREAPQALRKACELDIDLPELIHRWNFDSETRKEQVNEYLDLLEKRVRKGGITA